jgi:hypothetical protein
MRPAHYLDNPMPMGETSQSEFKPKSAKTGRIQRRNRWLEEVHGASRHRRGGACMPEHMRKE